MTDAQFEQAEIRQNRGPVLRFKGKLLASLEFTSKGRGGPDLAITLEIWETAGGAYVAVSDSAPTVGGGFTDTRAAVIEPGDQQQMRFAVLDHFGWSDRARAMVSKQLGWSLVWEIA